MKISKVNQNYPTFKALNTSKVSKCHMKEVILPCLDGLKDLANQYDIALKSSKLVVKKGRDYELFKPIIDVLITPTVIKKRNANTEELSGTYDLIAKVGFSYVPTVKNNQNGALLALIKNAVEKLG